MAYAVTHVLATIFILDLFRHYYFGKKKFPRYLLVFGGIAGLLPDIDVPISWIFHALGRAGPIHGIFIESFFFPLLFLITALVLHLSKKQNIAIYFYLLAFGWALHLGIDWIWGEYKGYFWPLYTPESILPRWNIWKYSQSIDAVILVLWLVHEELHNKIKDYF